MTKKFRNTLIRLVAGLTLLLLPISVSSAAYAAGSTISNSVECGTQLNEAFNETNGTSNCGAGNENGNSSFQSLLKDAVNIFSLIVGIVAVVMIIVGGFKYITSGGESSKVSGAQSTILYAIVGLVIVVLAQVIVHFVLNRANSASAGGSIYLLKFIR
jgi:cytochrome bd-type quinol oxidase subunit 2